MSAIATLLSAQLTSKQVTDISATNGFAMRAGFK